MAWSLFHRKVRIYANGNSYTFNTDVLEVTAVPYANGKEGKLSLELFDGRVIQVFEGFRHRVRLSYNEITQSDNSTLKSAILDMINGNGGTIYCDPDDVANGGKPINVVIDDASDVIGAKFDGGSRKRNISVTFVSTDIESIPKNWLPD